MSWAFLLTTLIVVATPGTGALFTITAGLSRGSRASLVAAAGCTLGIVPHMVAAITGLAAVLNASAVAFQTLKYLGVAYLLFLAWQTWRDTTPLTVEEDVPGPRSSWRVVRTAVLINVLNPKLTIFFFAFLPQFVPSGGPHALVRMLGLSVMFMLVTFVVFALYDAPTRDLVAQGRQLDAPDLQRHLCRFGWPAGDRHPVSITFGHDPRIRDAFPALSAGALLLDDVETLQRPDRAIENLEATAAGRLEEHTESEFPEIQACRRAFAQMGLKPTQYR